MNIALIVASGIGKRMGDTNNVPKQFLKINDKPLLVYTVEAFNNHKDIDAIVVVTLKDRIDEVNSYKDTYNLSKLSLVVQGGETRQESVYNGLKAISTIKSSNDDIILIHDAARVLISEDIISNSIIKCNECGAVGTYIPSKDTVITSLDKESINSFNNRDELFLAQTPQTFKYSIIKRVHDNAYIEKDFTNSDDVRLVHNSGHVVYMINGSSLNFKVTTMEDFELLKKLLK